MSGDIYTEQEPELTIEDAQFLINVHNATIKNFGRVDVAVEWVKSLMALGQERLESAEFNWIDERLETYHNDLELIEDPSPIPEDFDIESFIDFERKVGVPDEILTHTDFKKAIKACQLQCDLRHINKIDWRKAGEQIQKIGEQYAGECYAFSLQEQAIEYAKYNADKNHSFGYVPVLEMFDQQGHYIEKILPQNENDRMALYNGAMDSLTRGFISRLGFWKKKVPVQRSNEMPNMPILRREKRPPSRWRKLRGGAMVVMNASAAIGVLAGTGAAITFAAPATMAAWGVCLVAGCTGLATGLTQCCKSEQAGERLMNDWY